VARIEAPDELASDSGLPASRGSRHQRHRWALSLGVVVCLAIAFTAIFWVQESDQPPTAVGTVDSMLAALSRHDFSTARSYLTPALRPSFRTAYLSGQITIVSWRCASVDGSVREPKVECNIHDLDISGPSPGGGKEVHEVSDFELKRSSPDGHWIIDGPPPLPVSQDLHPRNL
jgi:hypothetical protein